MGALGARGGLGALATRHRHAIKTMSGGGWVDTSVLVTVLPNPASWPPGGARSGCCVAAVIAAGVPSWATQRPLAVCREGSASPACFLVVVVLIGFCLGWQLADG